MQRFKLVALLLLHACSCSAAQLRSGRRMADGNGWPHDDGQAHRQLEEQKKGSNGKLLTADDTAQTVKGCFIVFMTDTDMRSASNGPFEIDTSSADALIAQLLHDGTSSNEERHLGTNSLSATVNYQYTDAMSGFAACLSPASLQKVLENKDVAFVEQDTTIKASANQRNPVWGLDRVDQTNNNPDRLYSTGNVDGEGVDVYIIDTGVNSRHTEYQSRLKGGRSFVNDGRGYEDCNGHGTHCAGTVLGSTYGIAKKASLYGVRVLGCQGSGTNSAILAGVNWAVSNAKKTGRPSVLSLSLGGEKSYSSNRAIANAKRQGSTVVVAAGNDNANACTKSPASETSVITVGSTTDRDSRSSFSNYGTCVDIFAPGSSIKSAWIGGSTRTSTLSGTSMACPHVAGAAALELDLMKREGAGSDPDRVWSRMQRRATTGKVRNPMSGSPNLLLRVPKDDTPPPPTPAPTPLTGCGTKSGAVVGERCVFPFVNQGKRYTECTTDNDPESIPWCSTETDDRDNHVKGNWGHCNDACFEPVEPEPIAPPDDSDPDECTTVDGNKGKTCVFPFRFEGTIYHHCTRAKDAEDRLWCSTETGTSLNHQAGKWGHCNDAPRCYPEPPSILSPTESVPERCQEMLFSKETEVAKLQAMVGVLEMELIELSRIAEMPRVKRTYSSELDIGLDLQHMWQQRS